MVLVAGYRNGSAVYIHGSRHHGKLRKRGAVHLISIPSSMETSSVYCLSYIGRRRSLIGRLVDLAFEAARGASAKACDRNRHAHCCTWLSLLMMHGSVPMARVQIACPAAATLVVASLRYVLGHALISPA